MSRIVGCLLVLLSLGGSLRAQSGRGSLPPAPDSLRARLQSARTPAARQAAQLRVAAAYAAAVDSVGTMAYAQAAAALARSRADSAALGRAHSLQGFLLLQLGFPTAAAPLLQRAERQLATAPLAWQADNHGYLAWLLGDTDQPAPGMRYLRRAYAEYGRLGNAAAQAELSGTATVIYLYQGRGDSAAYVLLRAARQQHRLGLAQEEANTLGTLATVLHQLDRLPEAERYARQALATLLRLGNEPYQAPVYQTLGNIAWARHRPAEAVPHYRAAIRLLRKLNQEGNLVPTYGSLAGALSDLGQGDSAIYYQTKALRLTQQLGLSTQAAVEMSSLAYIYAHLRRWPEAERWARASLAAQGTKLLQNERPLLVLAQAAEARRDFREALRYEREVRRLAAARATRESQELVQKERARFETDRAEQQVALLTARTQVQADQQELERLRYQRQLLGLAGTLLLLLLLGGTALWYVRRRQARREEALRNRLAADLHDDVGTLLSQISLQSGLLQEGLADPAAQRQHLSQITEASRSAVRQLNDVVWSLDAHNDNLQQLADRLRDYAYEVLEPTGAQVQVEVPEHLPALTLPVLLRRNLYLIYKESLHNILKHAATATHIHIRLQLQGSLLRLTIDDNAPSLVLADGEISRPARRSGHGLRNMQARAEAIGGQLTSAPHPDGAGFGVQLRVPM
ncbi:tetratricopeptide repeat protein [Hymenobacter sp. ASUV-10]|uniref:Tetratricopeptide repeat protein n=1 Tax=Hymenobacter aranciens TaxID=3063996 RepID=A0ABT9B7E7_9BACT|nr:tetratricopeptide repeat protein [Hymenobacter sp. ASUV-10]MDO7873715.1 tetratricopeptide repeat protein [Hymenobacter sp. ASUV-10]